MNEIWDFSAVLSAFPTKESSDETNEKYASLAEEMKKQIDQISEQLASLESASPEIPPDLNLLTCPSGFPISPPTRSTFNGTTTMPIVAPPVTERAPRHNINKATAKAPKSSRESKLPPLKKSNSRNSSNSSNSNLNSISNNTNYPSNNVNNSTSHSNNSIKYQNAQINSSTQKVQNRNQTQYQAQSQTQYQTQSQPQSKAPKGKEKKPIFKATPNQLSVSNFVLSNDYKLKFTIQNISDHTHGFQVRGPADPAFSFRILGDINTSQIRPGLHVNFEVTFSPTEPRDYDAVISIISSDDDDPVDITITCHRDQPDLELADLIDLKSTLVHSMKSGTFTITNHGGVAFFAFHSSTGREDSLIYSDGPFTLVPSQFQLGREESIEITVKFKPSLIGKQLASFEIIPEHFDNRFYFIAQGVSVIPDLKFNICQNDFLFVPFLPNDNNTSKEVEIINSSEIAFPFHIQILKPRESSRSILKLLYNELNTSENSKSDGLPFHISPLSGHLNPHETVKIKIDYNPKVFGFFRSNLAIFADRIPDETGTQGSKKMLTIGVEASSGTPDVQVHPPLVVFNSVVPNVASIEQMDIINDSYMNIKLKWPLSEVVKPAPDSKSDAPPRDTTPIDIVCVLSKSLKAMISPAVWSLFRRHPETAREFESKSRIPAIRGDDGDCEVSFNAKEKDNFFPTAGYVLMQDENTPDFAENNELNNEDEDDEMPNIFSPKRDSSIFGDADKRKEPHVQSEMQIANDENLNVNFSYAAHIASPVIEVTPPVIDFGFVLTGKSKIVTLNLSNKNGCPVGYEIIFPEDCGISAIGSQKSGVVKKDCKVDLEVCIHEIRDVSEIITIKSWWHVDFISSTDENFAALPMSESYVKIIGCVDKPLLKFEKRIIDIGEIYPTLTYNATFNVELANSFPTTFNVTDFSNTVTFARPEFDLSKSKRIILPNIDESTKKQTARTDSSLDYTQLSQITKPTQESETLQNTQTQLQKRNQLLTQSFVGENEDEDEESKKKQDFESLEATANMMHGERSLTVVGENGESFEYDRREIEIEQKTVTEPKQGEVDIGGNFKLDVAASFAELGEHVMPIQVDVLGGKYTCAVFAHVVPPKISLITEKVDFSDDFVICRQSTSSIQVKNECGVFSTVHLEVSDDSGGVFQLCDITTHSIGPNEIIEFPIACYSEVHGDFYGSFKLIVRDLWQTRETIIPLHVKAHRSFFGFQKHTLGYTKGESGDFITFGHVEINEKAIRRLYVENYSSEPIYVEWLIMNFVHGRKYVDLDLNIDDKGIVSVSIEENENGKIMSPYSIESKKTEVPPHGKSLIVINFLSEEPGEFKGLITAKCGEFTHELDLIAFCEETT